MERQSKGARAARFSPLLSHASGRVPRLLSSPLSATLLSRGQGALAQPCENQSQQSMAM